MSNSIQDRIFAFVAERGEQGAASQEIAAQFLFPTGPAKAGALMEKLVKTVLAGDPRLRQNDAGAWVAAQPRASAAGSGEYAILQTTLVRNGARFLDVEWFAVRLDSAGRPQGTAGSAIRPDPFPPGLILPSNLRQGIHQAPPVSECVTKAAEFARGSTLVAFRIGAFQNAVAHALSLAGEEAQTLSLERLAKRTLGPGATTPGGLATTLGLPAREPSSAEEKAKFIAEIFAAMLARAEEMGLAPPQEWTALQHPVRREVDFGSYEFDKAALEQLPEEPGIYIFKDANGVPVYVGKALNLRQRVKSYFRARVRRDEKNERILESVSRLETRRTGSELAALLEESAAIRKFQPKINIQFDIHERPALAKAPTQRLALILPAPEEGQAELFLLYGDRSLRRLLIPRAEPQQARAALNEFFFSTPPAPSDPEDLRIVWSWLERHGDHVNGFDVELAGGLEQAMALLARYTKEEAAPGRVYHV